MARCLTPGLAAFKPNDMGAVCTESAANNKMITKLFMTMSYEKEVQR